MIFSNRRIVVGAVVALVVAAAVIGSTVAYFSDTETSVGNTFIAGKLNLKIDNTCHYNGRVCVLDPIGSGKYYWQGTTEECFCTWDLKDLNGELYFHLLDVKPGDSGEDTISLHVINNDAWLCAEIANLKNDDNGCESPETKAGDTTCGAGQGDLQNNLFFTVWKDIDCDNVLDGAAVAHCANVGETIGCEKMNDNQQLCELMLPTDCAWVPATQGEQVILQNQPALAGVWPIADSQHGPVIPGGATACYGVKWNVPLATGNEIQGDSLLGDVIFTAVQARHMDTFKCSDLTPSVCTPTGAETCNGLDDDCDGSVDEGNPGGGASCSTGLLGVCSAGTTQCTNGAIQCVQNVLPSAETCDGLDNNCDGVVDNGSPGGGGACTTGLLGVCSAGTLQCSDGSLHCVQYVASSPETCDGIDNDCDGSVDEGNPGGGASCNTGQPGICSAGTTQCIAGALTCTQNVSAGTEVCSNGLDDDCDGSVDEGCSQLTLTFTCSTNADCNDGNQCTNDICTSGSCGHTNTGQISCNDGNPCTDMDFCSNGSCTGMDTRLYDDLNSCTMETCNPLNGAITTAYAPVGSGCQSAFPIGSGCGGLGCGCNASHACVQGGIIGCTQDSQCTDGNACTTDVCSNGNCTHSSVSCNDGNPLTFDTCSTQTGCVYTSCGSTNYYYDYDGDGYGIGVPSCIPTLDGLYRATQGGDCNDNNALANPGQAEICGDFIDNNCNGQIDEGGCTAIPIGPTPQGGCTTNSQCNDNNSSTADSCVNGSCVNWIMPNFSFNIRTCWLGACFCWPSQCL